MTAEEEAERILDENQLDQLYSRWGILDYWTLDEAVALTFGKDPKLVSPETLLPYPFAPMTETFAFRRKAAERAKEIGHLNDPTPPGVFVAWAERKGMWMPPALVEEIKANGGVIADWKTLHASLLKEYELLKADREKLLLQVKDLEGHPPAKPKRAESDLNPRERNNLLRLVIAMAHAKYRFDPSKSKNSATQNIVADLAALGARLSEDTVLKYLREAGDLVDWAAIKAEKSKS